MKEGMFQDVVATVDPGKPPPCPRRITVGSTWLEWMSYSIWYKSFNFFGSDGRVYLVMIGSSEPGPSPIMRTIVSGHFDLAGARSLRDRLDRAIQAAESR